MRALAAVERSRVALILVDATVGFTEQDSKVAGYAHEQGKACIIVVNKWDAVPDKETNKHGCIVTEGDEGKTSRDGVYAGGDAVTGAARCV